MRLILGLCFAFGLCLETAGAASASAIDTQGPPPGDFQRSADTYSMQTAAQSGWQRGEEIYYYKCWMCHNQYAQTGPSLKDLYQRTTLMTGRPLNAVTVMQQILGGGPGMPAYRYTLSAADMVDIQSYLESGRCCFEEEPPRNPRYRGIAAVPPRGARGNALAGGPTGLVHTSTSAALEGIMVQLISRKTAIRTTVYSDATGHYEFPLLESGAYTLRIARPLEFSPYLRDPVQIQGATKLDDIILERVTQSELLPPTPEIAAQLTSSDWLQNLPGTGEVKRLFVHSCNWCHSYQQVFRNRYDEDSWRVIVNKMTSGYGSPLILTLPDESRRETPEQREELIHWLATVRGPDSKDSPFYVTPGPRGPATQVVITEYELPRTLLAPHDVCGDSKGHIWYTSHRSPYVGELDPTTGIVTEHRLPTTPGALPGTHTVWVDKNDVVWLSESWAQKLTRLDARTGKLTTVRIETPVPINAPSLGNFGLAPDGSVWYTQDHAVVRIDSDTGRVTRRYPFKTMVSTYDNLISSDGHFWAGGQWPGNTLGLLDIRTGELSEIATPTPATDPSKGAFDREGNAWFGGRGGALIRLDTRTHQIREYAAPTPYVSFYEAMPDKNGEVWAGEHQAGRFARFNPRSERWIEYQLPEPYAHDRRTWIDNSTDPVTVWYVDHQGYLVRLQPRL